MTKKSFGITPPTLITIQSKEDQKRVALDHQIIDDWHTLNEKASAHGIELYVVSAYRSFEDQKKIWNQKAQGLRELRNRRGELISKDQFQRMDPEQLLWTICHFSAPPGLSRHHWGSDLDVIDLNGLRRFKEKQENKDYRVELTQEEFDQGPFIELGHFLKQEAVISPFFRPYQNISKGVCPEPWHLSHGPVAQKNLQHISAQSLRQLFEGPDYQDVALREVFLREGMADKLYQYFFLNINQPLNL